MPARPIVIGTGNRHKIVEIRSIIGDIGIRWVDGSCVNTGPVEEAGESYEENAIIKAKCFSLAAGLPALADDSGLEVDALNGLPGLHSNRLFGEKRSSSEKIRELLNRMNGIPAPERTARFVCHAVIVSGENLIVAVRGFLKGIILEQSLGGAGFGYDPIFMVPGTGKTLAQMSGSEKNALSHRGIAMRQIRDFLLRCPDQTW